eukprot:m.205811 g.205811  ORF g.205811 m.205811 type:complete len:292 (-) comp18491_c0_seq15:216-1091(-)
MAQSSIVADLAHSLAAWYSEAEKRADARVQDWPLVASPWPTLGLTAIYLVVIFVGMRVMQDREPFQLTAVICVYNLFITGLSAYMVYEFVDASFQLGYVYRPCNAVDVDPDNFQSKRLAAAVWWYYFSKCIEFLDTVFFMLRKKNNQISFLHLYHHSTMFPIWWIGVKWAPGGQSVFGATLNSGVHTIMYLYYFGMQPTGALVGVLQLVVGVPCSKSTTRVTLSLPPKGTAAKIRPLMVIKKYITILQLVRHGLGLAIIESLNWVPVKPCNVIPPPTSCRFNFLLFLATRR